MAVDKSNEKARRRRGRKSDGSNKKDKKEKKSIGGSKSLLITLTEDAPTWYQCGRQLPGRDDTVTTNPPNAKDAKNSSLVSHYRSEADEIYKKEVQLFGHDGSSDGRWVENTIRKGTLKDRIAAMSVVLSTNPVHKLHALDGLLQMACENSNARMAQMAAEAIEDLFLNTLLPPGRKLLSLDQRPLYRYEGSKTLSPRILLLWRYEELLKEKYATFLRQYLQKTLKDGMELNKLAALRSAGTLLKASPEEEAFLLSIMVNKLGDPSKKTAAAAGHELRRVLEKHAAMQVVVAREVQQLAHRPHLSPRALYNCIIFLNQLKLTESSLAASLINTYFLLFEVAVDKSKSDNEGIKSRLLSALLTGVNRAHPYLAEKDKDLEEHIDSLYRVVHTGPPSASTQALMLLFHVAVGEDNTNTDAARQNRFYRALYATLSHIAAGKHLTLYFNLLYKAMKHDTNSTRVVAFGKRLLCTTLHTSPPVTAASLFLLNEIGKYHPQLQECFTDISQSAAVLDPTKREPTAALVCENTSVPSAPLWETTLLNHHFHPSVAKFAEGEISYMGDPLRDFSLAPFLDKFAYRNPKTSKKSKRGESVAQRKQVETPGELPVNDASFLQRSQINEQDEFYHKFFVERARRDEIKGIVRGNAASGDQDEAFDMEEDVNLDHNVNFEDGWDTDPEEEAFVDSLAQQLIEDAEEGPDELDDEDPDMEGWDDMYSDDDEKHEEGPDDDEDAFMDQMDEESDDGGLDENDFHKGVADSQDDAFMENDSDSDDDGAEPNEFDEGDEDDELGLMLAEERGSDEEEEHRSTKKRKSANRQSDDSAFADASEYEEMINKSWQERKRADFSGMEVEEADKAMEEVAAVSSASGKKKRRRRSKKWSGSKQ